MQKIYIFLTIFILFIFGCSSKKYYEPKQIAGEVSVNGSVVNPIIDTTRDAATLANGMVITKKDGLLKNGNLPAGFRCLNESDDKLIAANELGDLLILSKNDFSVLYKFHFNDEILTATLSGNYLSMVDAQNNILLYDVLNNKLIYKEKLHESVTVDSRIANPMFLNDLIIYPTLDGRLLIMNKYRKLVIRDIAISDRELFNNVIFLRTIGNTLIAATNSKVVAINPTSIKHYRAGIKEIVVANGKIYLFTKEGKVLLLSTDLQKINELNIPYAIFSGAFAYNGYIYAIEKTGYLLKIQPDLSSYIVKKLPSKIDYPIFVSKNQLYIGDKFIFIQ